MKSVFISIWCLLLLIPSFAQDHLLEHARPNPMRRLPRAVALDNVPQFMRDHPRQLGFILGGVDDARVNEHLATGDRERVRRVRHAG